ncbi:CD3324 family protein [Dysosmobacter sp.]
MRYMKAGDVLPPDLIDKIQSYIDGEYLYIPRRASNRKSWGAANGRRAQTQERNREICGRYLSGVSVRQLSEQYFLAPKSIQKIISGLK